MSETWIHTVARVLAWAIAITYGMYVERYKVAWYRKILYVTIAYSAFYLLLTKLGGMQR